MIRVRVENGTNTGVKVFVLLRAHCCTKIIMIIISIRAVFLRM